MYQPLPRFEHRIYPAHKLAALVSLLVEQGVPAADALAGSGIGEGKLHAAATRISYRQMQTVFRNAVRLAPDPGLALRAGQRMRVTAYGMYGYALLSSPDHAASVDFAVRHHPRHGAPWRTWCSRARAIARSTRTARSFRRTLTKTSTASPSSSSSPAT